MGTSNTPRVVHFCIVLDNKHLMRQASFCKQPSLTKIRWQICPFTNVSVEENTFGVE